ncbi:hypothetical protein TTHT_0401 [Thermotomaculum hydrothermale]|uniref:Uncharacterized protein n=1 Tax=Thermotomaculum hydrothermale TaxID=981385 RepID=A0A7R6PPJ5_9BACT|nr:hypothetical protein [Thermotomaculum hydrothermale]BBB32006.1 hypothetical protein TTHT_0401 [Thermotomaculum hydrothermale]
MVLLETNNYFKTGKSALYKISIAGKIPKVKIEFENYNKVIILLRHFFIACLLQTVIGLINIMEFLNHKSSKTTEVYTYVTTKNLSATKNPFDNL